MTASENTVPETPTRAAWVTPEGYLGLACRCGEQILAEVTADSPPPEHAEFAVTCDGCGASHWAELVLVQGGEQ